MGRAQEKVLVLKAYFLFGFFPVLQTAQVLLFRLRVAYSLPQNSLLKCLDNQSWSSKVQMTGVPIILGIFLASETVIWFSQYLA
ncbi:hypothetical protein M5K25_013476 [Dendrobium thyrsiflorum]|uniref:Uncharacterized protein n=1 Tax=Dendrobium thyrsiflorum TaxID=117978 RepID=A0ABD0V0F3_DENTH